MASYPIKFYTQAMTGAPALTNAFGDLTNLLDACLINGFNTRTVTSITSTGTVAELICAGHGFIKDQIILISGCDQAEYNGEQRVTFVSTNTLTFDCVAGATSPATGASITVKTPPLGFDIAFTATQRRAYRSRNVLSNRFYLYVDDSQMQSPLYDPTYAKKGKVMVAEKMTDIDTVATGYYQIPWDAATQADRSRLKIATGSGASIVDGWFKWYYAREDSTGVDTYAPTAGARQWTLIGDDRGFYFLPAWQPLGSVSSYSTNARAAYCFSDFESIWPGDVSNTVLTATEALISASTGLNGSTAYGTNGGQSWMYTCDGQGKQIMHNHTQVGVPTYASQTTINLNSSWAQSGYTGGVAYPSGPGYGILIMPTYLRQNNDGLIRGIWPGLMWMLSNVSSSAVCVTNEIVENITGYGAKKFMCFSFSAGNATPPLGRFLIDISGPWH